MDEGINAQTNDLLEPAATIVAAMVGNKVATSEIGELIASTYSALAKTAAPTEPETPAHESAIAIRLSVMNDYIVCLEDGAELKMLKRYLRTRYNMTLKEHRSRWGLQRDYSMVATTPAEPRDVFVSYINGIKIRLPRRDDDDRPAVGGREVGGPTIAPSSALLSARDARNSQSSCSRSSSGDGDWSIGTG